MGRWPIYRVLLQHCNAIDRNVEVSDQNFALGRRLDLED